MLELNRYFVVAFLAVAGCSNSSNTNDSGTPKDSSTTMDSTTGNDAGGDAGGGCTQVMLPTLDHSISIENMGMPKGNGGTINDGDYEMAGVQFYYEMNDVEDAGAPMGKLKGAMKITGNKFERVFQAGSNAVVKESGTFTTNANNITFNITCPSNDTEQSTYNVLEEDAGVTKTLIINMANGLQLGFDKK